MTVLPLFSIALLFSLFAAAAQAVPLDAPRMLSAQTLKQGNAAANDEMVVPSGEPGSKSVFHIPNSALRRSPSWTTLQPPSLSVEAAIRKATQSLPHTDFQSGFKWGQVDHIEMFAIMVPEAKKADKQVWLYRLHFTAQLSVGGMSGLLPTAEIIVLMSGQSFLSNASTGYFGYG